MLICKKCNVFLIVFVLLSVSCRQQSCASNVKTLENEMIAFFQETLEDNYGRRDALAPMMEGLKYYNFHYIMKVDKKKLQEINRKLYPNLLSSYFLNLDVCIDSLHTNWGKYDPYAIIGSFRLKIDSCGNTFYQKELVSSTHPFIKTICDFQERAGAVVFPVIWGQLAINQNNCRDDFKDNRDVQMFLTLFFWRYLCYCANIDFQTGQDKTKFIMDYMK